MSVEIYTVIINQNCVSTRIASRTLVSKIASHLGFLAKWRLAPSLHEDFFSDFFAIMWAIFYNWSIIKYIITYYYIIIILYYYYFSFLYIVLFIYWFLYFLFIFLSQWKGKKKKDEAKERRIYTAEFREKAAECAFNNSINYALKQEEYKIINVRTLQSWVKKFKAKKSLLDNRGGMSLFIYFLLFISNN